MATIKYSPLVSDVRGKVGGNIFSRNGNGAYVRTFRQPISSNTALVQIQKNNMSYYSQKWRDLSDSDRQSWTDAIESFPYANRVGEKSTYSGFQLFMKTNMTLNTAAFSQ